MTSPGHARHSFGNFFYLEQRVTFSELCLVRDIDDRLKVERDATGFEADIFAKLNSREVRSYRAWVD